MLHFCWALELFLLINVWFFEQLQSAQGTAYTLSLPCMSGIAMWQNSSQQGINGNCWRSCSKEKYVLIYSSFSFVWNMDMMAGALAAILKTWNCEVSRIEKWKIQVSRSLMPSRNTIPDLCQPPFGYLFYERTIKSKICSHTVLGGITQFLSDGYILSVFVQFFCKFFLLALSWNDIAYSWSS